MCVCVCVCVCMCASLFWLCSDSLFFALCYVLLSGEVGGIPKITKIEVLYFD